MCAEGIRIGRSTDSAGVTVTAAVATGTLVLKARPSRLSLILTTNHLPDPGTPDCALFRTGKANTSSVIAVINSQHPTEKLTVEEFGQIVTGEVWVEGFGDSPDVFVTEVFLDVTIDEAATP